MAALKTDQSADWQSVFPKYRHSEGLKLKLVLTKRHTGVLLTCVRKTVQFNSRFDFMPALAGRNPAMMVKKLHKTYDDSWAQSIPRVKEGEKRKT